MNTNLIFSAGIAISLPFTVQAKAPKEHMNVLMLIADDMRPELGCYGVDDIVTPNIDRLAKGGVVFENAYCNIPVSGASRASLLTGVYPKYTDRFVHYSAYAEKDALNAVPISQWFKDHGYYAVSNGKVFHHWRDHANSLSEEPWRVSPDGYDTDWAVYNRYGLWQNTESAKYINPSSKRGLYCESAEVDEQENVNVASNDEYNEIVVQMEQYVNASRNKR